MWSSVEWDRPPKTPIVVRFFGQLENHASLRAALSVTEPAVEALIEKAYEVYGADLPSHLRGEWALALWDGRKREILLACDPIGLRPLFYAEGPGWIRFSDHTKDLTDERVDRTPNQSAIIAFLLGEERDPEETFYRGIKRLPGGHRLIKNERSLSIERTFSPERFEEDARRMNAEAFARRSKELLLERIRAYAEDETESALLLSGGFDSTLLAGALATRINPLRSYSAAFLGLECDESDRIEKTAKELGLDQHTFAAIGKGITPEDVEADIAIHDAPYVNLQRPIFDGYEALARAHGVRRLITGLGGDELATDYEYWIDQGRQAGPLGWWSAARRMAELEAMSISGAIKLMARGAVSDGPGARLFRRVQGASTIERMLSSGGAHQEIAQLRADVAAKTPAADGFGHTDHQRWRIVTSAPVGIALAWWTHELGHRGLTPASPLFDPRLLQLVLTAGDSLPRSYESGQYKPLISVIFEEYLPRAFPRRYHKASFEAFHQHVMDASLEGISSFLWEGGPWRSGTYVSRAQAENLFESYRGARALLERGRASELLHALLRVIGLEAWLRSEAKGPG